MKRLSALLLAMVATAASAAIYPSSEWFGTNVQKQTTAAGVRAALGITSTGGSATNVYFTSGQSTTPRTVSGSNTFDVTGTLTNYTRNYSAGISNNAADSVNVVFQSANRLVFNDPTGGEQAHYVWGRAGTSLGSQDSFWWNPDLNFSWLSFFSHPFMGVGFNDDRVLIEWNYDESNAITNHIYGTNTSITIDGRYRGAGLSLTSTETNSSLTGGVLAADANGKRKIATLSGLSWDGSSLTVNSGGPLVGDGSGVTNVPSKFFTTIAAMTNYPGASNLVVYVDSYFGSNVWGGGKFRWDNTSETINGGTIFAANGGGRWKRFDTGYPTNFYFMEWFGVVPNAAIDQYAGAQACINATPSDLGSCILPPYGFAVGTSLTWTNRKGCYFGALNSMKTKSSGYRVFPYPVSTIHWMGVSGGTNLVCYDVGHNTFAGFGLDTRIGLNNGDQWTNAAGLLMDVDMYPTHSTTTSANVFDGIYFRERGTNTTLVGQRIASYNWQNCEFFRWYDCYWQGGGWNLPQYWVQTTNIGAYKAVQLGGNGGGGNSFQHYMFNCGWDRWMYDIHSTGGNWEIDSCKSTAAGAAAFYLNGDHPSIIRFADCEGDRQFLISPGDTVQLVGNRIADAVQAGYTNLPPIDAVKLLAYGNYLQHEAYIPSLTNSFNSTGSYDGAGNSFDTTNDALIASWRFNSAFNSRGDFGTLKANNNIQSGPWKVPSATQETNVVYQNFTDGTASTMALTMMPSNGVFGVGSYLNNVHFGAYNPDLNKTSMQFGDSVINPRFNLLPSSSGLITELRLFGSNSVWLELYNGTGSSATRLDLVGSSAVNKIHARTGSLKITGTNDTDLVTFGTDYKIKFPYDTNFEVVGPIQGNSVRVTNFFTLFTNDSHAGISTTPTRYGQVLLFNRGSVLSQKIATTNGVLEWRDTNTLATSVDLAPKASTNNPTLQGARIRGTVALEDLPYGAGLADGFLRIRADDTLEFSLEGSALTNLNADEIRSGTVATARLGSGTANSSTFLRGDNTWATPAGGGYAGWETNTAAANAFKSTNDLSIGGTATFSNTVVVTTPPNTSSNGLVSISDTNGNLMRLEISQSATQPNLAVNTTNGIRIAVDGSDISFIQSNSVFAKLANRQFLAVANTGSSARPSYATIEQTNTGWANHSSNGTFNVYANGTLIGTFSSSSLSVMGSLSLNSGVTLFSDSGLQIGTDNNSATAQHVHAADGVGGNNNQVGAPLLLEDGRPTGTGNPSGVRIATSLRGTASGASYQSRSTRYAAVRDKSLTESTATTFVNLSLATGKYLAVKLLCTVAADDATDFQSTTTELLLDAVNKAGTITATLTPIHTNTVASSGTLTVEFTAVQNASSVDLKANATSSLTQSSLYGKAILLGVNSSDPATVTEQ